MNEEEIQHLLKFKTQWWNELRTIQKAEKGNQLFYCDEHTGYELSWSITY